MFTAAQKPKQIGADGPIQPPDIEGVLKEKRLGDYEQFQKLLNAARRGQPDDLEFLAAHLGDTRMLELPQAVPTTVELEKTYASTRLWPQNDFDPGKPGDPPRASVSQVAHDFLIFHGQKAAYPAIGRLSKLESERPPALLEWRNEDLVALYASLRILQTIGPSHRINRWDFYAKSTDAYSADLGDSMWKHRDDTYYIHLGSVHFKKSPTTIPTVYDPECPAFSKYSSGKIKVTPSNLTNIIEALKEEWTLD